MLFLTLFTIADITFSIIFKCQALLMLIKIKNYPYNFFHSIVFFKCGIPHDSS